MLKGKEYFEPDRFNHEYGNHVRTGCIMGYCLYDVVMCYY